MSKNDSKFQVKFMSFMFKGKEIFKPLNTGFIDDRVSCIREYVANIYFYTKDGHTIMTMLVITMTDLQKRCSGLTSTQKR